MVVGKRVDGYPPVVFGDEDYLAEYLHKLACRVLIAAADGAEVKLEVRHKLMVNLPKGDVRDLVFRLHEFLQPSVSPVIFHQRGRSLADAVQLGSVLVMLLEQFKQGLLPHLIA